MTYILFWYVLAFFGMLCHVFLELKGINVRISFCRCHLGMESKYWQSTKWPDSQKTNSKDQALSSRSLLRGARQWWSCQWKWPSRFHWVPCAQWGLCNGHLQTSHGKQAAVQGEMCDAGDFMEAKVVVATGRIYCMGRIWIISWHLPFLDREGSKCNPLKTLKFWIQTGQSLKIFVAQKLGPWCWNEASKTLNKLYWPYF